MLSNPKIQISLTCAAQIRAHGEKSYPNECCGALLGRDFGEHHIRQVLDVLPLLNRRDDSPQNRFSVSPRDVIEAEKTADVRGLQIVGWYHSHPDCPPRPSGFDKENAWPWYSYLILSVREGLATEMKSWRLLDSREEYLEEQVEERSSSSV